MEGRLANIREFEGDPEKGIVYENINEVGVSSFVFFLFACLNESE